MAYTPGIYGGLCREDDIVYFGGESSSESWAGVIGDEYDMTDEQVNDYIKSTKPALFDKLRGMRFSSSGIPLSFKPMRDLRRLDSMKLERQDWGLTSQLYTTSLEEPTTSKPGSFANKACRNASYPQNPLRNENQHQVFQEEDDQSQYQDQLKLDGVDQATVLSAAERLYPKIKPAKTTPASFRDKNVTPDHAFKHAPNSKQALDLRALKQLEINETLAEVSKYEKALKAAKSQLHRLNIRSLSPDASVLITRPHYMEPKEDRYKKQGLTRYDRAKYTESLRRDALNAPAPVKDMSKNLLFCYCREPDDGREMVRCSKQWCPVGWFHLNCTGLDRLPFLNEEFHCCYCSDGVGPLVSTDLLDQRHRHPEAAAKLVDSVAQHYLDNEIETEVVYKECDGRQSNTNAPGRFSIYDDEADDVTSDVTEDETWVAEDYARLHDKVVKWRAVNDPYQRSNICGQALNPSDDQTSAASSTASFFGDDSDDSQHSEDEEVSVASGGSTVRASSPIVAISKSAASLNSDKENFADDFYEQEDGDVMDSETTAIDSANDGDDECETDPLEFAYHGHGYHLDAEDLTSKSAATATTQPIYPSQPSTMTDSTHLRVTNDTRQSRSSFLTIRDDLPTHFPSFNSTYQYPVNGPRTPTLAPRISPSKSRKPWGTPVNIKDFDFGQFESVAEPVSPSPIKKRKFGKIDEGESSNVRGGLVHLDNEANEQETEERLDEYENDEEHDEDVEEENDGEMADFMLDNQRS